MTLHCLNEICKRDGADFKALTGHDYIDLFNRALIDQSLIDQINSLLWTPEAADGRKMKIKSLYQSKRPLT